ncbi:non-specific lipid-transfer protein 1-like [Momordica charantia]|uniref:Non-specific lipid-transfer protein n=1 Tax=Momordica charantia TaxID=3673 RepID=A0A6J1DW01_MOMCH|nr:non-specific lipid-transfer protein 1-like [Momordica charantia]
MEMSRKMMIVAGMVMMWMVVGGAAISCGSVNGAVAPCISYLRPGGVLSPACCSGVKNLNSQASTTADRQAVCQCLKSAAGAIQGIDLGRAAGLPGKCGVSVPYKISPSTDCSKVH